MRSIGRTRHVAATATATPAENQASARALEAKAVLRMAQDLLAMVEMVNLDEFRWQEDHYDHDSRQGRELLFLMANHEWVRATSEIVDISRSDAVETTIKIDIDLSRISHEAFRARAGRLWLPVAILPPQADERHARRRSASAVGRVEGGLPLPGGNSRLEPDPFATVTDAAGGLLPLLPDVDLRHQIAAALAEIIVKMAVSHLPSTSDDQPRPHAGEERAKEPPVATLDQRLLLSAAIYQMLSLGTSRSIDPAESKPTTRTPRLTRARTALAGLLGVYIESLERAASIAERRVEAAAARTGNEPVRGAQFTPELARRAILVLQALAESVIVVVPLDYKTAPTVLTVRVPTRALNQISKWFWYRPHTWLIKPSGHLEIDVLLATPDTDRQIQVNLPDGVLLDEPASVAGSARGEFPHLDIDVNIPPSLLDLSASMKQVAVAQAYSRVRRWPMGLVESFAELARLKSAAALATLQHYEARYAYSESQTAAMGNPYAILKQLATDLDRLTPVSDAALDRIREAWQRFRIGKLSLSRRTSTDRLSPQTVVARMDMIEDVAQRATPKQAKVYVDVTVDDRDYFSIARSSAFMSLILMVGVLAFLLFWQKAAPTPEVLAIVLTLFATIQASRIERPDRSTLQGQLFAIGNALIAASMLPPVTLAVVLAFRQGGSTAEIWAGGCCFAQLFLMVIMRWGPLTPTGSFSIGRRRRDFETDPLDYRHFEALRSDYWQNTTADALMIGREAYGYVFWQLARPSSESDLASPKLRPLLNWDKESLPEESSSVLALLRSGTQRQAVTFVVFRGTPDQEEWDKWLDEIGVRQPVALRRDTADHKDIYDLKKIDLDPGRLTPTDSVTSTADVFVGIRRAEMPVIKEHPLVVVLKTAKRRLIVLDAQLPVPAPLKWYDDWKWARIRVALRDSDDIGRLTRFVDKLQEEMTHPENCRYVVAVRVASVPRIVKFPAGVSSIRGKDSEAQVLTADLDIVNCAAVSAEPPDARTWRLLVICADARSNIESDIIQHLASVREHFQLAGLTYALLHGTAVIVLLVHERNLSANSDLQREEDRAAQLQIALQKEPAWAKLRVVIDKRLSRRELEPVSPDKSPLLRVRFRWRDRPGASLNVLNSVSTVLGEELTGLRQKDWSVSYARIQVVTGQVALGMLTIRMHIHAEEISGWNFSKMEEIGRKIETLAAAEAVKRKTPSPGDELDKPEDPVISIDRIKRIRPA